MLIVVDDLRHLNANQKALFEEYLAGAEALDASQRPGQGQLGGAVVPTETQTRKQALKVDELCREIMTMVGKVQRYARHVSDHHINARRAAQEAEDRTP